MFSKKLIKFTLILLNTFIVISILQFSQITVNAASISVWKETKATWNFPNKIENIVGLLKDAAEENTYPTLADLTAAFPKGNTNIYVVAADKNWYYFKLNAWRAGGLHQGPGILQKQDELLTNLRYVTVGKKAADFASIQEALDNVKDSLKNPITIILSPGVYKEHITLVGRNVSITGIDRDTCIIKDDSGDYYKTPLNISGNASISNLSFIATNVDGTKYEKTSYAVHCDSASPGLLIFYNCKFSSNQNSAVGIGLHQDQTLEFNNCEFRKNASYDNGCFYCHNAQASNTSNQHLIVKNCHITTNLGIALKIDDANTYNGGKNSQMDVTFENNILYSDEKGKSNIVLFRDDPLNGGICGQIKLSPESANNNVSVLNPGGNK